MDNITLMMTMITHTVFARLRSSVQHHPDNHNDSDSGSVSLENVLWVVAVGIAVVVIAAIVYAKVKEQANKPVQPPTAP